MKEIQEFVRPLTYKGTVTIPIEVRRILGVKPKDNVTFRIVDGKRVELLPPAMTFESAFGSVKLLKRPASFKHLRDTAIEEHVRNSSSKRK
jgi:bifunctional DNA-binding transcriptional regulator/antitoxin component of YhaV-PrlF toxin-antitoxin module